MGISQALPNAVLPTVHNRVLIIIIIIIILVVTLPAIIIIAFIIPNSIASSTHAYLVHANLCVIVRLLQPRSYGRAGLDPGIVERIAVKDLDVDA